MPPVDSTTIIILYPVCHSCCLIDVRCYVEYRHYSARWSSLGMVSNFLCTLLALFCNTEYSSVHYYRKRADCSASVTRDFLMMALKPKFYEARLHVQLIDFYLPIAEDIDWKVHYHFQLRHVGWSSSSSHRAALVHAALILSRHC